MIDSIKIIEYIGINETRANAITNFENVKITQHKNLEMDTCEIVFNSLDKTPVRLWSRVAVGSGNYDWYVYSSRVNLVDKKNKIYTHIIILIELSHKFKSYKMSNLSFNNFLTEKKYNNLYDIVTRVNLLAPFEVSGNILETRIISSEYEGGVIVPKMTERLETLLKSYKDVPEFQFVGNNLFEVYNSIFSLIGGTVNVICTEGTNKVLDIQLFSDRTIADVNINDYYYYEDFSDSNNYATRAEIGTNNIVDNQSLYIVGADFFRHIGSEDKVLEESQAKLYTDLNVYKLLKATVKYKPSNTADANYNTEADCTDYIKSIEEWNILDVTSSTVEPSSENTLTYTLGAKDIKGFAQTIKSASGLTNSLVWQNFISDLGLPVSSSLFDYVFQIEFIPLQKDNRFNVCRKSFIEKNVDTTIDINASDRINEISKVVKNAQNKITQANVRQIIKKCRLANENSAYELGARDVDTGYSIVSREFEITRNSVNITYILVNDTNIISDVIGINSINRFTDVEVGGGLVRNEIYEDYCIFTEINPTGIEDSSSVKTEDGKKKFINLFVDNHDVSDRCQQFVLTSSDFTNAPIVTPSVMTANRVINFDINLLNQTFVGNKIVQGSEFYLSKLIERGVRYTQNDATLENLSLSYGYAKAYDKNTITQSQLRTLPELQDLLIVDNSDTNYLQPLIEIGTTIIDVEKLQAVLYFGPITNSYSLLTFVDVTQKVSRSFDISEEYSRAKSLNTEIRVQSLNARKVEVEIVYTTIYNVELTSSYSINAVSFSDVVGNTYWRFNEFSDDNYYNIEIPIDADIKNVVVNYIVYYRPPKITSPFVSGTLYYKNIILNYLEITQTAGDGLYIDKNQNEILGLNYQMHYTTWTNESRENIIIGSGITRNSPYIINNNKKYVKFNVYITDSEYNIYSDSILGVKNIDAIFTVTKTSDNIYSAEISGITLLENQSYGITGEREDGTEDFMYAVNPKNVGEVANNKIYIFFAHKHPMIIYNN